MNYIGSKLRILDFISEAIKQITNNDFESFCDIFSGTCAVGSFYKRNGYKVIANDLQYYSYVLARHYIGNSNPVSFEELLQKLDIFNSRCYEPYDRVCDYLNCLPGYEGYIYSNYCFGGTKDKEHTRQYFSDVNGKKCDHIRITIEQWKDDQLITDSEYYYLLTTLLESIDKYANTASVYGAFLKKLKKSALKEMELKYIPLIPSSFGNMVYNYNSNDLINEIEGDVLYLDPPYNQRQYATNYHLLETIAKYDNPVIRGKTGLRDYSQQKSLYCAKNKVLESFEELISKAKFKYIFLSYNNEGLMSLNEVQKVMERYGKYGLFERKNLRFKADNGIDRNYKSDHTYEYLHYIVVK